MPNNENITNEEKSKNIQSMFDNIADKYDFLIKTLPFLKPENFIFTNTKNIIKADIQIDDRVSNLVNDIPIKILFPSYHNKEIADEYLSSKNIIRAGKDWRTGWQNVLDILIKEK